MAESLSPEKLLSHPAVRELIAQGARDGHVSYSQINDLLIDLELDEADVDTLLEALERRAIAVSDEAPVDADALPAAKAAPAQKTSAKLAKPAKRPSPATSLVENSASHDDLDALLAQLDDLLPTDVPDVAQMAGETGEELDDEATPVDDALKLYLNRMGQVPRLSPEEEKELAGIARDGDSEAAHEAKNKLVEANLRLVVHLAHHAGPRTTLSITDLLQEGNLGLLDAVERYRPESNKTFGAYATWWIRRALNRAINEHARSMKLSGELYNAIQKLQTGQRQLTQDLGRVPTRQELANFTGLTLEQVETAQRAAIKPLSLDAPTGSNEEGSEFGELLADDAADIVDQAGMKEEIKAGVQTLVEGLSEREELVVQMRYGLGQFAEAGPRAADDVAKSLNISRERVNELETRALRKLRKKAKASGLDKMLDGHEED